MPEPPIPPPLEPLASKPFSFYPAVVGIEHNEWDLLRATWAEILVENRKSGQQMWIPRRYIGELSRIDEPVLIVGLVKELEYKSGSVWPYQRRVIEMPPGPAAPAAAEVASGAPPPHGSRQFGTESRITRLIGIAIVAGILLCLLVLNLNRVGDLRARVKFTTRDQSYLELGSHDDYWAVVRKLGRPVQDRWQSETGAIQFQAMSYPERGYTVILMGGDRKSMHYIGALDKNWTPVHSIELRSGGTTFAMLRGLQKF